MLPMLSLTTLYHVQTLRSASNGSGVGTVSIHTEVGLSKPRKFSVKVASILAVIRTEVPPD